MVGNPDPIVITGMGIVSALGIGKSKTWEALRIEKSAVGKITYLQTEHTDLPAGEVPLSNQQMRDILKIPDNKIVTRNPLIAMLAAKEACDEAQLTDVHAMKAFINGTTVGGMDTSEQYYLDFLSNNNKSDFIAMHDCGIGTEQIADFIGHIDFITTTSTACSSALNSLILAADLLESGRVDVAVAGGSECLSKFHLNGFNSLMILDHKICRPFDNSREGLNLGEGAAYLVMEKFSSAQKRGVRPICILSGYGNQCDAYHQTASSPNGEGAYLAMKQALNRAGLQPSDIDYINAHGTGTQNNDASEGAAIYRIFGEHYPLISSTKAFTGHTTSAAGGVESVISILSLQYQQVPANLFFNTPMQENPIIPVVSMQNAVLRHVMNNSFGFGGNDSSCIFSKIE